MTTRRTRTSTAVKRRYNEKHYKRFYADVKIELYDRLEAYRTDEGISRAEFLQKAIDTIQHKESEHNGW